MIEYPEDPETKLIRKRRGITTIGLPPDMPSVSVDITNVINIYRETKDIVRHVDIARGKIVLTKEVTENAR